MTSSPIPEDTQSSITTGLRSLQGETNVGENSFEGVEASRSVPQWCQDDERASDNSSPEKTQGRRRRTIGPRPHSALAQHPVTNACKRYKDSPYATFTRIPIRNQNHT